MSGEDEGKKETSVEDNAAVEAAVAEAAQLAAEQAEADEEEESVKPSIEVDPNSGQATKHTTKRHSDIGERDVVINSREDNLKMHLFLEDLLHMYNALWCLQGKTPTEGDFDQGSHHIVQVLKTGKKYELGGLRDVPRPFLRSTGRILERDDKGAILEISDDDAVGKIRKMLVEKISKDSLRDRLKESPYVEFKRRLERNSAQQLEASTFHGKSALQVETADVILTNCSEQERELEQQGETKVVYNMGPQQLLFNLAAQIVTTYTMNAETQIKAALAVLNGLDEMDFHPAVATDGLPPKSKHSRFLLRSSPPLAEGEAPLRWSLVSDEEIVEWAVTFVFEVHLEKDLDFIAAMLPDDLKKASTEGTSKVPVKDPTIYDVLFGRGGMTNSHVGNRRFRDIIALHRPDYIRAIKMDKPAVARKIVKAIRFGNPPGRFLKKSEDGNWYDVGDRTASEKTSQGLRERTNAEKRQRSQLRRALRLRKEDLEEGVEDRGENEGSSAKKGKTDANAVVNLAATLAPTLNYVGTNIAVPLSLNMGQVVPEGRKKPEPKTKPNSLGLSTEGLPPNAVDEEGNILVTDYDILLGRGGLTNHHKGNKRFRDIVALHRPDYVRAPKIQKPSVARVIVRAIRNGDPPGRFLRKDDKTGKWVDVGDKKAAEKTSQALREKATEVYEKANGEATSGAAATLVPTPASYLAATTANVMGNILASGIFSGSGDAKDKKENGEAKEGDEMAVEAEVVKERAEVEV